MSQSYWDICYAPEGIDQEKTRFLRLHAAPADLSGPSSATIVIIHGGYWKKQFGLDDAYHNAGVGSLAPFFVNCGMTAVELEYRRRDHQGGGWPGTNEDILLAIQRLCELKAQMDGEDPNAADLNMGTDSECSRAVSALRLDKLVLLGHSAGGCLALWAAHQLALATSLPCHVAFVISAAPVADLVKGHEMRVSDEGDAVELYMKCRPDSEDGVSAYQQASPAARLPLCFPVLVVYGDKDCDVPPELVESYVAAVETTTPELVSKVVVAGADHFDIVNAGSDAWRASIIPSIREMVSKCIGGAALENFSVAGKRKFVETSEIIPDGAMGA